MLFKRHAKKCNSQPNCSRDYEILRENAKVTPNQKVTMQPFISHISPSPWIESGPVYITKPDNMYGQLINYSLSDFTERTRITKYPVMPMTP